MRRRLSRASLVSIAVLTVPAAAPGQVPANIGVAQGVLDRSRPEYDATGLHVGGFTLLPAITAQGSYDSNVLSTTDGRVGDALLTLRPRVQLRSNWSRHALSLVAEGEVRRFADRRSENSEQVRADVQGRLDASADIRISASAGAARLIEGRGTSGDALLTSRPIAYRQLGGSLQADGQFGRALVRLRGAVDSYHYEDGAFAGVRVPLDFRDYRTVAGTVRAGYALGPGMIAFVEATASGSRYPEEPPIPNRDSNGYELLGGVGFNVTDLISGEIGFGYLRQSFRNTIYAGVSGIGYRGSLVWNPTPLTSITADASRDVERAPFRGVGGVRNTEIRVRADHELLRQMIVSVGIEHVRDRYVEIDRTDRRLSGDIGARYLVSRALSLNAGISHRRQRSSGASARGFAETIVRAGVTIRR